MPHSGRVHREVEAAPIVEDELVQRILASEGGQKLLSLSEAEMSRFLTAAESTIATYGQKDAAVRETLEAARATLDVSATTCDLVLQGSWELPDAIAMIGALSIIAENGYSRVY